MSTIKNSLRNNLRQQRLQLTPSVIKQASERIATQLLNVNEFLDAQHVALYMAQEGEVDTQALTRILWRQNKKCYLPIVADTKEKNLAFIHYQENDTLIENRFGILEPVHRNEKLFKPEALDLVLMPVVGFDTQGNRLGRGAGYYDHTFHFLLTTPKPKRPVLIGLAYDFQEVETITPNDWDVPLDCVVTESTVLKHPTQA